MKNKPVTEPVSDLLRKATQNVKNIKNLLNNEEEFDDDDRQDGGYFAQQMTEKLLKAYLKEHNVIPDQGHDLTEYYEKVLGMEISFKGIENEVMHFNNYQADVKYSTAITVDNTTFKKILEDTKTVYNFSEFQKMYDKYVAKGLCKRIKKQKFDAIIERFNKMIDSKKSEELAVNCMKDYILPGKRFSEVMQNVKEEWSDVIEGYKYSQSSYFNSNINQKVYVLEKLPGNNAGSYDNYVYEINKELLPFQAKYFIENFDKNNNKQYYKKNNNGIDTGNDGNNKGNSW